MRKVARAGSEGATVAAGGAVTGAASGAVTGAASTSGRPVINPADVLSEPFSGDCAANAGKFNRMIRPQLKQMNFDTSRFPHERLLAGLTQKLADSNL